MSEHSYSQQVNHRIFEEDQVHVATANFLLHLGHVSDQLLSQHIPRCDRLAYFRYEISQIDVIPHVIRDFQFFSQKTAQNDVERPSDE